jgi:hypothetical protein
MKSSRKAAQPQGRGGPIRSGGGLKSNKVVTPKPVAGKDNQAVNPGGADALGQHGKNQTPLMGGPGYKPGVGDGNYRAWTCEQGPGGGRTVYQSGYQSLHGTPVQGEKSTAPDPASVRSPNNTFSDKPKGRPGE